MAVLSHFQAGGGPRATLLLHGWLGSGRNLAGLARRWAEADPARRLIVPDLTGHGASPPLPPGADLPSLARDVLETAQALALPEPFDLVGHSLGGRVALAAALLQPERVGEVVLLDIAPGPTVLHETGAVAELFAQAPARSARREDMRSFLLAHGLAPALAEWLLTNLVAGPDGYGWRVDREALRRLGPAIAAPDLWGAVERPGARVRCVRGALSAYVSDADAARLRAAGAPVTTVEGAGHFVHVDRPGAVLAALAGVAGGDAAQG
jgi:pimeloyl-ACP methyl ester carboxylesterase